MIIGVAKESVDLESAPHYLLVQVVRALATECAAQQGTYSGILKGHGLTDNECADQVFGWGGL